MTKTDRNEDDMMLDSFFEAGRAEAPVPSQELMARILEDARANMPAPAPIAIPVRSARRGVLAGLLAAVGGWPSVATMATAAVAGVWLGFVQPDTLNTLSGGTLLPGSATTTYEVDDLIPSYGSFDGLLTEEG